MIWAMISTSPIRRFRDDHKLTQADLGERVGVTAATISRWEQGLREPRGEQRRRLCEVIGIPVGKLLAEIEPQAEAAQ